MGKISKKLIGILLLLSLCGSSFAAYGAETSDEITKISITVESSIEAGDSDADVSVAVSSSRYSVDSWEFSGKSSGWKAGEEPKIKVYIGASDEYYFKKGMSKSKVSVHGGGSCTSLKITDEGETAELTIKLKVVSGTLGNTGSAYWDEDSLGKAKWDKVENANAYEVKLYRGNTLVEHKDKVTGTSCNLYPFMDKQGTYTFKVRAIPKEGDSKYLDSGEWIESDELDIDKKEASSSGHSGSTSTGNYGSSQGGPSSSVNTPSGSQNNGWIRDQNGWWFRNQDGSYTKNGWQYINDKWYLFDMNGYMMTGWQKYGTDEYYLTSNGDMVTGWYQDNRKWYYLSPEGKKMVSSWIQTDGNWYFTGPDGVKATGWLKWKDNWYYLNPADGKMMTNTVVESYYINQDGVWIP